MIEIINLKYKNILKNITLNIPSGKFIGIIGPNGAGKSTLLKNIYGGLENYSGKIFLDGLDLKKISRKEKARKIAVLAQEEENNFDFSMKEIVEMGRYPYKNIFEGYSKEDRNLCFEMLKKVGMEKFADKSFKSLSGGEKQKVLIARALVQNTEWLVLDEPTNHLDISSQLQIFHLIQHLNINIIAVLHDLNMACIFCDYIIVIKDGEIKAVGEVEKIFTSKLIEKVFGVKCYIGKNPYTNKLHISYMLKHYHVNGMGSDHYHRDGFTGEHTHR